VRIRGDAARAYQRSLDAVQAALDAAERQRRRQRLGLDEAAREQAPEPPAELLAEPPPGAMTAGRWDTGPVVPNPGAGMWASGERVAAAEPDPAPAAEPDDRAFASFPGARSRGATAPEDRVRWSTDLERPTTDRWKGTVRLWRSRTTSFPCWASPRRSAT
jgi:hypothetical protein